jgi:hypothetical protein
MNHIVFLYCLEEIVDVRIAFTIISISFYQLLLFVQQNDIVYKGELVSKYYSLVTLQE